MAYQTLYDSIYRMSGELRKRVNVARIPKKLYGPTKAQQAIIRAGLTSSVQSVASADPTTKLAMDAISRQAMKANAVPRFGRAARIAAAVSRASGGVVSKTLGFAASSEAGLAAAAAGLSYGIGKELYQEHQHRKQDEALQRGGYQEISASGVKVVRLPQREEFLDPLSSGSHRVSHQHEGLSPLGQGTRTTPELNPIEAPPPPGQSVAPSGGGSLYTGPRFEKVRNDLLERYTGQARFTPVHGFRISRTEPYNLVEWERAANAKAMTRGSQRDPNPSQM
jgi:hypothetical protein